MKALLIEKTKQERIINEVQKKRNLFGLGLTSLIAACSADNAGNGAAEVDHGIIPQTDLEATPLGAVTLDNPDANLTVNLATAGSRKPSSDLFVTVKAAAHDDITMDFIAQFKNGDHNNAGSASIYKGFVAESQYDLVVSSKEFGNRAGTTETGAIYIFWDIAGGRTILDVDTNNEKYLKVAGVKDDNVTDVLPDDAPLFYQIGGAKAANTETDQPDMVFRSGATADAATNINILWDVTKHAADPAAVGGTKLDVKSNEILQVQGVGAAAPDEFTKINNNDGYDMIVQGTGSTADNTYILWDVANYHNADATAKAVVNLATDVTAAATATHGLLTIKGAITDIHKATAMVEGEAVDNGFTDINKGGINDIAFTDGANTYILFGEKVADRDGEKAKSYSVDLTEVATFFGSDTTKAGFFSAKDSTGADVAQAGYRFAAADQTTLDDLDAITTEYAKVEAPALSEEVYWDIA